MAKEEGERDLSCYPTAMENHFGGLADRLLSAQDSILLTPEAEPANEELRQLAVSAALGECDPGLRPLVEPFDGGALVEILFLDGLDTHLVAITGPNGATAAVVTGDQGEADSLYAGLAEQLGILNGKCENCSAAIASVYEYCADCV